jgi:hypothetical protein
MYNEDEQVEALLGASQEDARLGQALIAARRVCNWLSAEWSSHELAPDFSVELGRGADDEPILAFTITLALSGDFPTEDWPGDDVARIKSAVRGCLRESDLLGVGWYVKVAAGQLS